MTQHSLYRRPGGPQGLPALAKIQNPHHLNRLLLNYNPINTFVSMHLQILVLSVASSLLYFPISDLFPDYPLLSLSSALIWLGSGNRSNSTCFLRSTYLNILRLTTVSLIYNTQDASVHGVSVKRQQVYRYKNVTGTNCSSTLT